MHHHHRVVIQHVVEHLVVLTMWMVLGAPVVIVELLAVAVTVRGELGPTVLVDGEWCRGQA